MSKSKEISVFLLRVALGWLFFYSGLTKILDPEWTSAGLLGNAQTFSGIYEWFGNASNIGWVDFLNAWGQLAIGTGLMIGAVTSLAAFFGIILMVLYYFPTSNFPYVEHGFLVDQHMIYAFTLALLIAFRAGKVWGADMLFNRDK